MLKAHEGGRSARELCRESGISERRACLYIGIARSTKRYQAVPKPEDAHITGWVGILTARWKRFSYRRLQVMLKRVGILVNHKKVYRFYNEAGLILKKKHQKKAGHKQGMPVRPKEMVANERWSMDFVSDTTCSG